MTKEIRDQFEAVIYDKNDRIAFIDKTFVTPSSMQFLEKSIYSFILNKIEPFEATAEMKFGTAFHCMVLDGLVEFASNYAVLPDEISELDGRTKEYKTRFAEFMQSTGGREILTADEYNTLIDMHTRLFSSEIYDNIFDNPKSINTMRETMIEFRYNDVKCRGRLDFATELNDCWHVTDLKTCQSTLDLQAIQKDVNNRKYYRQLEFYRLMMLTKTDKPIETSLIFCAKEYPNLPLKINLDETYKSIAQDEIYVLTEKWRKFIEETDDLSMNNNYISEQTLEAPKWLKSIE